MKDPIIKKCIWDLQLQDHMQLDYENMFQVCPHPCFIFTRHGEILKANPKAMELLKYWNDSEHLLNAKNLKTCLFQLQLNLENMEIEVNKNYYSLSVRSLKDGNFIFYGSDITHKKHVADSLFRLVDDINEGLILVDKEDQNRIIEVNKTACDLLGYSKEEFLITNLNEILTNELFQNGKRLPSVYCADESSPVEAIFKQKNGNELHVELVHSNREIMEREYHLILLRDISEKLRLKKEKEILTQKAYSSAKLSHIGQMATTIAHEVNNPMTVITGKLLLLKKMLKQDEFSSESTEEAIEAIQKTVKRVTKVIQSLKNLSRNYDAEDLKDEYFAELLNDILDIYSAKATQSSIDFQITGKENIIDAIIHSNRGQIYQCLSAIINRAFDSCLKTKEKKVTLSVKVKNNEIHFLLKSSGAWQGQDIVKNLFEPFSNALEELNIERGLELAIAQHNAVSHHGKLHFYIAGGSSFFELMLPCRVHSYNKS